MNLTDDMLRQSAAAARDAMLASLPEPEDCPAACSPRLRRRLGRLLRRQRHPVFYSAARRAAACFLAVLVLGGGWLAVDQEARSTFFQWSRQVYETQIVYRFAGEPAERGVYRIGWVPEGYTEWRVSEGAVVTVYYVNADGEIADFSYGPMQEGAAIAITDTDQSVIKQVEINGFSGTLYLSTNPASSNVLIWLDEEQGMFFSISGRLDESDILHIAESICLEDSTK